MRFCGQCGGSLAILCRGCGATNDANQLFCGQCGAKLAADAPAGNPSLSSPTTSSRPTGELSRPASERRHVTVLFADLVGFTSLSEQRDAEDVRELLSDYFALARTVIGRYSGRIEKFIGDAVMAVWGVPAIQENDAERAVRAALELVAEVSAFGERAGIPGLRARAGVLTGEAAVNLDAHDEAIVAGDLVNTASRLQSVAEPGIVFVGESTRSASEAAIEYEDAGSHQLKGKPEPVRLWRAARVIAGAGGALRPTGLEPPFVGRDRELRQLKEFLHATSAEGRARLLSVVGLAGVGKSRLAWEFFKYIDGLTETIWYQRGRCLAYGEGVAFWALTEMVRMRTGIVENEPPDTAKQKLRLSVEEFIHDEEERAWVEPRMAHLLGLEERAGADPRDLYAAWRVFFERMAAQHTTLLIFEDLQWADSGLLDFIEYLLEWSRSSPIMVVALARPELGERRPGWGTGKRGLTSLFLEPLSPDAMGELLTGLVPGLPQDLRALILDRAAGVPLYAVETVRMLIDRGLLVEDRGTYRAKGSLEALEVPESLHALIAARLDSLAPSERSLLQDAAVLGKSFTVAALSAVTNIPESDVEAGLTSLVGKDLLAIQADPRSPERGQYVFVQDLIRSVAHGTLARRERKSRHLSAATYLAGSRGDEEEIAEVVAAHLVEAYDADPGALDAPEIRERARLALVRAAEHADSLGGAASAQRYYEHALELSGDDETRADLHQKAGQAARLQGRGAQARAHFETAQALYAATGRPLGQATALSELGKCDYDEGNLAGALQRSQDALATVPDGGTEAAHQATLAYIEARLARFMYFSSDYVSALPYVERALQVAETEGLLDVYCLALDTKGAILAARGRRAEAEVLIRGALAVALEHDLIERAFSSCANLATTLEEEDRIEPSLEMYEQAAGLMQRLGDRPNAVGARLNCIQGLLELGRWDEVEAMFADYLEADADELGSRLWPGAVAVNATWLFVFRGDEVAARRLVEQSAPLAAHAQLELRAVSDAASAAVANAEGDHVLALATAESTLRACIDESFPVGMKLALIEAVEAAFLLRQTSKVMELLQLVRDNFRPGRQPSIDAHILRWEARMAAALGDNDRAGSKFTAAIDHFARLQRPFWLAVTRCELGEWLVAQGRQADAQEQLGSARAMFEQLRATPWGQRARIAGQRVGTEPASLAQ
ncbi:MAG: adenylate/guanylate cyclase domain-containing protein [Candidatus Dormiibacterota bacterium]